jgi:penicillin-binding protein 2
MSGNGLGGGIGTSVDPFFEQRVVLAAVGIAAVFALFGVRLFLLQVVQGKEHLESSLRNSIRTERLEAPRGEILDRERRVLATTRPAFHLDAIPSEVRQPDRTFRVLAALIGDDGEHLREEVAAQRGRARFQPVRLAEDLSWEHLARVESHRYALPGVFTEVRPRRSYPHGSLAAHLLGTVGEIRADQLEIRRFASYHAGDLVGQSGLETVLEEPLRGRAGGRNVVVDVAGREVEVLDRIEPRPGGAVVLTLDLDLQQAAEQALLETGSGDDPVAGAVVALDPRNGDVLALVSLPSFDPNDFSGGMDTATWHSLSEDPERPLQNRALSGQYPPGSTYKALVAAAALQEGVIAPGTTFFCPGQFTLGRRTYRCWKHGGHGQMNLHEALTHSCDVYFYRVGLLLGIDRLAAHARSFGLGHPTGIALGGESTGLVPSKDWKEKRFGEPWMLGETVSAAIGQGFDLVTPLQLAVAYAAVANGGKVMRPRLVLEIDGDDGAVARPAPEVVSRVDVAPEHLARVRRGLSAVVNAPTGTGRRGRVEGLEVAGKTGTAQVVRLEHTEGLEGDAIPRKYRDHAWFAAFAPAEDAEIVVVVLVEHGGGGGSNAAPVAQKVLSRWFEKRRGDSPVMETRAAALETVREAPPVAH